MSTTDPLTVRHFLLQGLSIMAAAFSFGIIADIQYADLDDGCSFSGVKRYYRHALDACKLAVAEWETNKNIVFVAQLGDIIDGFNKKPRIRKH